MTVCSSLMDSYECYGAAVNPYSGGNRSAASGRVAHWATRFVIFGSGLLIGLLGLPGLRELRAIQVGLLLVGLGLFAYGLVFKIGYVASSSADSVVLGVGFHFIEVPLNEVSSAWAWGASVWFLGRPERAYISRTLSNGSRRWYCLCGLTAHEWESLQAAAAAH